MKKRILIIATLLLSIASFSQINKDVAMHSFVNKLLAKMTLEEKLGQLNLPASSDFVTGAVSSSDIAQKVKEGKVGGVFNIRSVTKIKELQEYAVKNTRLHIPLLFGMDVIHGYRTIFPIPIGMSATWDMSLIERSARIAANEASSDGIMWTFSPMVDLTRDPRWGRTSEGNGEDAFLSSAIAKAMVHGYQGDDLSKNNTIMSCVKHYALYGAAEGGRDYNTTDMSRVRMYNEYFPPYKAAVDAGVGSVMVSFNEIDGVPASGNKWLVDDVLRKQWKFNGFVVSDYTGIPEMVNHGIGDYKTVNEKALQAGVDMDMVGEGFLNSIGISLKEGKITQAQIDKATERILIAKYQLGLFHDPYKYCDEKRSLAEVFNAANRAEARTIASQSFVLLKNNNNILPIAKGKTIALVGPLANAKENMTGTWSVGADNTQSITLLKGLTNAVGDNGKVLYAKGSNLEDDWELEKRLTMFGKDIPRDGRTPEQLLQEALVVSANADVIVAALGEGAESTGESASRSILDLSASQQKLLKALLATGKPVVLVLFNGRPLTLTWEDANVPAILDVWFAGSEAGDAIADALLGKVNPSGKLSMSFPQNVGQIPLYYNHKNTGRPLSKWFSKFQSNYIDVSNEPLYPFGYGLSYTKFEYSDFALSSTQLKGNQKLMATVTVKNIGAVTGKEVVQLYIRDIVGTATRPIQELKGFQKIELAPGESRKVSFEITPELLKFYNTDLKYDWESGDFNIMVGTNSRDVKTLKVNWSK
ncbi:MAG: beta-glucosidase BglX [Chitinophagia bacterium]|nr:beta-glucosidase BglX [Chitinophagia bacterium]NCA29385.1 beta-glucosidase BglX [Chitinophagia bacterium]NDD15541.1 beta-glucosidase BglX [Chitinophagia bacterium]